MDLPSNVLPIVDTLWYSPSTQSGTYGKICTTDKVVLFTKLCTRRRTLLYPLTNTVVSTGELFLCTEGGELFLFTEGGNVFQ